MSFVRKPLDGLQSVEHISDHCWYRDRPSGDPVNIDVYEAAYGARDIISLPEERDAVYDARRAEAFDVDTGVDRLWKAHRFEKPASRLGDDADGGKVADVGATRLDEESIHRGVEERVVRDVVDVAVVVVVHPAGGNGTQHLELRSVGVCGFWHGDTVLDQELAVLRRRLSARQAIIPGGGFIHAAKARRGPLTLLGLLVATAVLYSWQLGTAPAAVSGDEALFAIHGKSIADTGCDLNGQCWPLLVQIEPDRGSRRFYQPLLFYAEAASFSMFPVSAAAARLPLVVVGIINIVLIYFVGMALVEKRQSALVAALVLASSPAHYFYSRQATDYLLPVPFILAWLWCTLRFLRTPAVPMAGAMGVVLGVGTFSYVASWFVMPALLAMSGVMLVAYGGGKRVQAVLALAAGYAVIVAPAVIWLMQHPEAVNGLLRHYEVATDGATFGGVRRWLHYYRLLDLVSYYWTSFNPVHLFAIGTSDLLNGTRAGGLFLIPVALLLVLGVSELFQHIDRRLFLVAGALIGVAPAVVNSTPAVVQRELALLPFAAAIAAIGYERLQRTMPRHATTVGVFALVLMLGQFGYFARDYFTDYRYWSTGRYDPLNVKGLWGRLAQADAEYTAPEILLTFGNRSLGAGSGAEAYWGFYALVNARDPIASKTRFVGLDVLKQGPLKPGTLIVNDPKLDPLPEDLGITARLIPSSGSDSADPVLAVWRVGSS